MSHNEATEQDGSMCGKRKAVYVCVFSTALANSGGQRESKAFGASNAATASWEAEKKAEPGEKLYLF